MTRDVLLHRVGLAGIAELDLPRHLARARHEIDRVHPRVVDGGVGHRALGSGFGQLHPCIGGRNRFVLRGGCTQSQQHEHRSRQQRRHPHPFRRVPHVDSRVCSDAGPPAHSDSRITLSRSVSVPHQPPCAVRASSAAVAAQLNSQPASMSRFQREAPTLHRVPRRSHRATQESDQGRGVRQRRPTQPRTSRPR